MYISKRESNSRKISELGSLPPPAELNKFAGKSASQLEKALDNINQKLKKYSHVNKKAFEQYVSFNDSRESLLKRKEELDRGADRVEELIESLDLKKDEAINRTFRGVSKNFREVFKDLVPNGSGELVMRTGSQAQPKAKEAASEDDDDVSDSEKKPAAKKNLDISLCEGIGIKVRFAENSECFLMSQLSGGQKALVAMALIFAIQRKPASWYFHVLAVLIYLSQVVILPRSICLMSLIRLSIRRIAPPLQV
jgi:structural maintenance of chromosome 3 (chondroitin sulfate proteoglycan 6)